MGLAHVRVRPCWANQKGAGNNPVSSTINEQLWRKRAKKGRSDIHFVMLVAALAAYKHDTLGLQPTVILNNARMVCVHPVLIRSSDSDLNAFFPTLFLLLVVTNKRQN